MGNDLETSEALHSALFCMLSKERFLRTKLTIIFGMFGFHK